MCLVNHLKQLNSIRLTNQKKKKGGKSVPFFNYPKDKITQPLHTNDIINR